MQSVEMFVCVCVCAQNKVESVEGSSNSINTQ